jgi:hypothetical protein
MSFHCIAMFAHEPQSGQKEKRRGQLSATTGCGARFGSRTASSF